MKKQTPIILEIPKPCTESWAEMTPMGLGRFCTHCQKTVTDITQMSDAQVVQLFQKNTDTHCIRAFASQLNRPISFPKQEPTRFYRIAVALGLTLVMATASDAYARPRPPLLEQNYLLNEGDTTKKEAASKGKLIIRGKVVDENNSPFPGIVVKILKGGIIVGVTETKENGTFLIRLINKLMGDEVYEIEFYSPIYHSEKRTINNKELNDNYRLNIQMTPDKNIHIMGGISAPPSKMEKPGNKTYNADDLEKNGL